MINLKLTKKIAIMSSSFVLSQALIYAGFTAITGVKPFKKNEYETHLITMTEYSKDGKSNVEFYRPSLLLESSLLIKTPYYEIKPEKYERKIYRVPLDLCSNAEIQYIMNNVNNQKDLLEKDYVKELIDGINTDKDYILWQKEEVAKLPIYNDYEISYATFEEDPNKIEMEYFPLNDTLWTSTYLIETATIGTLAVAASASLIKKYEQKKKK